VKTEFGKFAIVLQKTREKLSIAINEIDNADTRTRAIEKKLRDVRTLPEVEAQKLLGDLSDTGDDEVSIETDTGAGTSVSVNTVAEPELDVSVPAVEPEPEPVSIAMADDLE